MQLISRHVSILLLSSLVSCGPDGLVESDWMLGIYSSRGANESGQNVRSVIRYEIREDGKFIIEGFGDCSNQVLMHQELEWTSLDEDTVEVLFRAGEMGDIDSWLFRRDSDCHMIRVIPVRNGEELSDMNFVRGAVCLQIVECPPYSCYTCKTVWCDGEPPPCADEQGE